jgi:hypothetical protein
MKYALCCLFQYLNYFQYYTLHPLNKNTLNLFFLFKNTLLNKAAAII